MLNEVRFSPNGPNNYRSSPRRQFLANKRSLLVGKPLPTPNVSATEYRGWYRKCCVEGHELKLLEGGLSNSAAAVGPNPRRLRHEAHYQRRSDDGSDRRWR